MVTERYETTFDLSAKQQGDLEGVLFGFEACAPSHGYGPTLRPYHLMHFVTAGYGVLKIGGQTWDIGPGDAFLIPHEWMAYYEASSDRPWCYSWFGFTGVHARGFVEQILLRSPERYVLRGLDTEKYASIIATCATFDGNTTARYFFMQMRLYELLFYLSVDLHLQGATDAFPAQATLPARVRFYLDTKYTERLKIADVAAQFHVHPSYLARVFREQYGCSPKHYLIERKIEKAKQMLAETDVSINLIAESLGFEDRSDFSRTFQRYQGSSPTVYRKNNK